MKVIENGTFHPQGWLPIFFQLEAFFGHFGYTKGHKPTQAFIVLTLQCLCGSVTFFARAPVHHGELGVVLVRLPPPRRLLIQGADRVVGRSVAAANQLRFTTRANVLTLKLSVRASRFRRL